MAKPSFIYSHVSVYRLGMSLLYRGKYRQRFRNILDLIGTEVRSICEPCFADTYIAAWCASRGIRWTGIDINRHFCLRAQKYGFDAIQSDIFSLDLPDADAFIMAGSLYHFPTRLTLLLDRVLAHTNRFILSEPISNLSSQSGLVGWLARRSANPGKGDASFRFTEHSLLAALREEQQRKGFTLRVVSCDRDILIEINR